MVGPDHHRREAEVLRAWPRGPSRTGRPRRPCASAVHRAPQTGSRARWSRLSTGRTPDRALDRRVRDPDTMGIRYYAYAFDADRTAEALASPRLFLSSDPLADAWGLERGARCGAATFRQAVPDRDMLYLDKAWGALQNRTRSRPDGDGPRPSYRMFEGGVDMNAGFSGWKPWMRPLTPGEVKVIARDLEELCRELGPEPPPDEGGGSDGGEPVSPYVLHYLHRARRFASGLVEDGRGMVYMIG